MGIDKKTNVNMNFNNLPCDIKWLIFKNNRPWTSQQIQSNKNTFDEVMEELWNVSNLWDPSYDEPIGSYDMRMNGEILTEIQHIKEEEETNAFHERQMLTGEFVMCNHCFVPYRCERNNNKGIHNLCIGCVPDFPWLNY